MNGGLYWIDQSCINRPSWDERILTEAMSMSANTNGRNAKKTADETFQTSFDYTMNTEQDDDTLYGLVGGQHGTPWTIVDTTTGTFASMTKTDNQAISNVRVYCDFDPMFSANDPNARWRLIPDLDNDPIKNSQRTPGVDQEYYDHVNLLRRSVKSIGCQADPNAAPPRPLMEVANNAIEDLTGYTVPAGLAPVRSVISVGLSF